MTACQPVSTYSTNSSGLPTSKGSRSIRRAKLSRPSSIAAVGVCAARSSSGRKCDRSGRKCDRDSAVVTMRRRAQAPGSSHRIVEAPTATARDAAAHLASPLGHVFLPRRSRCAVLCSPVTGRAAPAAIAGLHPTTAVAQRGGRGGQPAPQPQQPAGEGAAPATAPAARRGPRPYDQVVPGRARTEHGGITVHRVDDRWLFEVPDSLMGRDFLMVRLPGRRKPAGTPGLTPSGAVVSERMVRWSRAGERVLLQVIPTNATADESLPIAQSVRENYYGPILAAFPIQAFSGDSTSYVVDVTDFFGGDTPALSGLNANERRTYGVRRYDAARSYVSSVRSFPINVEVRHVQTFDATDPPADRSSGTVSLEMRQSIVLLPKAPMRPRYFDPRVGFFTISHINYGLDEQKAATQTFITRWRLEPKDPAAYARGEIVEPIKPIVYYIDPATPQKWRRYVKEGVEAWQKEFEKAGFKNAILAKDPPTKAENPGLGSG